MRSEDRLVTNGRSEIVWVAGSDAVSFLDGLISQNVAGIPVWGTGRSLLLAPNGKLRATLFVLRGEDRVGLVCDAGRAGIVAGDLARFKIRVDVTIEVAPETIWEVWGRSGAASAPPPGSWADDGGVIRFRMPFRHVESDRVVLVGSVPDGEVAAPNEIEAFRIRVGEPVMGVDLDESTIPQEGVDVTTTVDFTKGCYLGQELVARIDTRGHVNRRLAGLVADVGELDRGAGVVWEGRDVGVVTSVASRDGKAIALAMIRAEVEAGAEVEAAGVAATVVALPMSS
jgi:folate-binding protein YgfZ